MAEIISYNACMFPCEVYKISHSHEGAPLPPLPDINGLADLTENDLMELENCVEPPEPPPQSWAVPAKFEDVWVDYGYNGDKTYVRSLDLSVLESWMESSYHPDVTKGPAWWKVKPWLVKVKVKMMYVPN